MCALATVCLRQGVHTVNTLQKMIYKLCFIKQHLNDLGTEAQAMDRSTLANIC